MAPAAAANPTRTCAYRINSKLLFLPRRHCFAARSSWDCQPKALYGGHVCYARSLYVILDKRRSASAAEAGGPRARVRQDRVTSRMARLHGTILEIYQSYSKGRWPRQSVQKAAEPSKTPLSHTGRHTRGSAAAWSTLRNEAASRRLLRTEAPGPDLRRKRWSP